MTTELRDRLAELRVGVDAAMQERHLEATFAALREPPAEVVEPRRRVRVLRPITVVILATLLLIPVGAVASDDAIPGDALYPIKRTFEWVWSGFDDSIAARHRIEELEEAVRRGEPAPRIAELLAEAEAVAVGSGPALERRLERVRNEVAARAGQEPSEGAEPTTTIPTTEAPEGSDSPPGTRQRSQEGVDEGAPSGPGSTTVTTTVPPRDEPQRHGGESEGQGDTGRSDAGTGTSTTLQEPLEEPVADASEGQHREGESSSPPSTASGGPPTTEGNRSGGSDGGSRGG